MILTKDTAEITTGEKNSTGAVSAGNAGFFPEVKRSSGSGKSGGLTAIADLALESVRAAFTGT